MSLDPSSKIIGGTGGDSYHNGGEWLNSVFNTGAGVTGFIHAEYHFYNDGSFCNECGKCNVHKSIALGEY